MERGENLTHDIGLGGKLLACRCGFFARCGIGLYNRGNLIDALHDLVDGFRFMLCGIGDPADLLNRLRGQFCALRNGIRRSAGDFGAVFHSLDRGFRCV